MSKVDGGSAFPVVYLPGTEDEWVAGGMSLRDYLAGQALTGIIAAENSPAGDWQQCAKQAYQASDAMLAERDK